MKDKILKAMTRHLITDKEEAAEAINFVIDLLYSNIEDTETNEPYAVNSIAKMKESIQQVSSLEDLLDLLD